MRRPVLAGAAVGMALSVVAWLLMLESLTLLDQRRVTAAGAAAATTMDAAPDAPFRMRAGTQGAAQRAVATRLRRDAAANAVLVERIAGASPLGPGLARINVELSGSEKAVLIVADAIEREQPGVRWREWRLAAVSGGAVRLSGDVAIAWR
ncbi:hypothetical protein [Sphingomonas sp.]|uniref:hypothetical protein n=1 Tax=Sphingomonas sp. TaxID=28214 RepID=UPI002CF03EA2|nr:hypothetical protein [Sphingomonas sp.]HTG38663.1 hypothetical protein [Sphingomonas sp.]